MSVAVRTETTTREQLLAKARELSARTTKRSIEAGITTEQLEKHAREALARVKRSYRSSSN